MRRLYFFLFSLLSYGATQAQSLDYLTFCQTNGAETSLAIEGLTVRFTDGVLTAGNGGQTFSLPLAELQKMFFSATPTGITTATAEGAAVRLTSAGLTVNAPEGEAVQVYSPDGRLLMSHTKATSGTESWSAALPGGVYLVRVGERCYRVSVVKN